MSSNMDHKLFNAHTYVLNNGLQVIVIENHRIPVITQLVCYRVGGADDPVGKSGLAHYLEHMMFKGANNSAGSQIMQFVDQIGGNINAMTSYDATVYYENSPQRISRKNYVF